MKKIIPLITVLLGMALFGCASSPLVNTFMDPDIPVNEHAILAVDNNLNIAMIDGQMTLKSSGNANDGVITTKSPLVMLTPGKHRIDVQYLLVSKSSDVDWRGDVTITTKTTQTDFIPVSANFVGGHFYRIYPRIEGKTVYFEIEETTPTDKQKAKIASVKYPKKIATLLVLQKAAAGNPSPLEGTYVLKDNEDLKKQGISEQMYTFQGQSFIVKITQNLSDGQLNQQNIMRKYLGEPPLQSNILYSYQRGVIEVDGQKVNFKTLQTNSGGMIQNANVNDARWISSVMPVNYSLYFSFTSEGNLFLGTSVDKGVVYNKERAQR